MHRRGLFRWFFMFLLAPLGRAYPNVNEIWHNYGGFYTKTSLQRQELQVTRVSVSVETFLPEAELYPTTLLERLRSAGVVEPNDPLADFYPVRAEVPEPGKPPQSRIWIITLRGTSSPVRIRGNFVFTVDGARVDENTTNAAQHPIRAQSRVEVFLIGGTGTII